ncbi:MAG: hypothetical protein ACLPWF_00900 [Bryobacteraceae bacterium]
MNTLVLVPLRWPVFDLKYPSMAGFQLSTEVNANCVNTTKVKGGELIPLQIQRPDDIAPFNHDDQDCGGGCKPIRIVP